MMSKDIQELQELFSSTVRDMTISGRHCRAKKEREMKGATLKGPLHASMTMSGT